MALGFLAAWQVLSWLCRRTGRVSDALTGLVTWMMVCGVVGARVAYVIEHWHQEFAAHPERIVRVDQGGLMFYGGLILAIGVFLLWCRLKKERILPLADMMTTVIPLGHAFGRIGCFFYGCCYGRVSQAACAVSFPRGSPAWYEQTSAGLINSSAQASLPVLPTQLFEAAAVATLFAILVFVYIRFWKSRPGFTTGIYLIGYALIRFGMEVLRGDPRAAIGPLSIGQTISLALLLTGVAFAISACRRGGDSAERKEEGEG
jgi:phosphatidylglycerol:prolipoprotein diacylglycerol transferase